MGGPEGRPMMNVPGLYRGATDRQHGFGQQHGQQNSITWGVGDTTEQTLVTVEPAAMLWRVSVFGDVLLLVQWGTSGTVSVNQVQAPLVAAFPGRVTVTAVPRDAAAGATAYATLTPASSPGIHPVFRRVQSVAGPFPAMAHRVVALTAANVTVAGVAVALAVGESIPLVDNSALVAGTVLVELVP